VHYATEIGTIHFAIYGAEGKPAVVGHRQPGEVFIGLYVDSLDAAVAALNKLGAPASAGHERVPWGCRVLYQDPDGRTVEINDRAHCRPETGDV
jgi:predicted enzyme related to lactoylglutathione lyase